MMKRVEVKIPFHIAATNTMCVPGDVIDVSEELLAKIRAIRADMVSELCDVEEQDEPEPQGEPDEDEDKPEQDEPEPQGEPKQPKKGKTKKQ